MMMRKKRRRKWRRRRALYLTGLWESCVAAAKVSLVLMCTSLLGMCSTAESCCLSPAQTGVFWFGSSAHGLPPPSHSCLDSALQQENYVLSVQFSSVQSLSCVWLYATPWTAARQASCPSPTPRTCSDSCPSSWWCHPTMSSFVIPFSSCLQSFPASGNSELDSS